MKDRLFEPWCEEDKTEERRKYLLLLTEKPNTQRTAIAVLQSVIPQHYYDAKRLNRWLKKWGKERCVSVLKGKLPATKIARSGDIGEILATEFVNRKLDYNVPIFRLRWRDDREMALRGDDIFAVRVTEENELFFLKGEVKSRQQLSSDAIDAATTSLRKHDGRPAPYTINFVVSRLYELAEIELSETLEDYLSPRSIPQKRVTHLLFTLSGNNPQKHLEGYMATSSPRIDQIVIGLRVKDHAAFIKSVFDGVNFA